MQPATTDCFRELLNTHGRVESRNYSNVAMWSSKKQHKAGDTEQRDSHGYSGLLCFPAATHCVSGTPSIHKEVPWSLEDNPGGPNTQYGFLFHRDQNETWRAPLCPAEHYLIHVRTGDPVSCVPIWARSTLEAILGVRTSDTSETRAGVTPTGWASWGCWRSYGHQCV